MTDWKRLFGAPQLSFEFGISCSGATRSSRVIAFKRSHAGSICQLQHGEHKNYPIHWIAQSLHPQLLSPPPDL